VIIHVAIASVIVLFALSEEDRGWKLEKRHMIGGRWARKLKARDKWAEAAATHASIREKVVSAAGDRALEAARMASHAQQSGISASKDMVKALSPYRGLERAVLTTTVTNRGLHAWRRKSAARVLVHDKPANDEAVASDLVEELPSAKGDVACDDVACDDVSCEDVACDDVACDDVACDDVACDDVADGASPGAEAAAEQVALLRDVRTLLAVLPDLIDRAAVEPIEPFEPDRFWKVPLFA